MTEPENSYQKKLKDKEAPEHPREDKPLAVGPPLSEIGGGAKLQEEIKECETTYDWSFLLNEYINWGNNTKVHKTVGIFNMGAAHDCPNRWTDRCQVGGDECYSVRDERMYEYTLDYFRRQEYLWDCMDAETFLNALKAIIHRKRNDVNAIKFSQAGDFRTDGDIIKVNQIADGLEDLDIPVFTYSASNHLDWSLATSDNLIVNQSNEIEDYGDKLYRTYDSAEDMPNDFVWCPYNNQKKMGVDKEERKRCGECTLCFDKDAPDVGVLK